MGECWLLKSGCEAEGGNESLRGADTRGQGEEAQVVFDMLTPCYATELEHNPNILVLSTPQLYYSNLRGTWASESIISGLGFVFFVQKSMAIRMTASLLTPSPNI